MAATGRDIAHWTVAFYGRPRNLFERLVFKPGFRHCIAFAWLDTDCWLEIHPTFTRQRVRILTGPQYSKRMIALTRSRATFISIAGRGGSRWMPRLATCAGVIAHMIGSRPVLRPHQLYLDMVRSWL